MCACGSTLRSNIERTCSSDLIVRPRSCRMLPIPPAIGAQMRMPADAPCVGGLGCGNMGAAIPRHLAGAGHRVSVWPRTASRANALIGLGVHVAPTVRALTADAGVATEDFFEVVDHLESVATQATAEMKRATLSGARPRAQRWACTATARRRSCGLTMRAVIEPTSSRLRPASCPKPSNSGYPDHAIHAAMLRRHNDNAQA
jgi:hypothetical protein